MDDMKIVTVFNEMLGVPASTPAVNKDCTDFPTRGCSQCGRTDRPQWMGVCNDGSCDHWDIDAARSNPVSEQQPYRVESNSNVSDFRVVLVSDGTVAHTTDDPNEADSICESLNDAYSRARATLAASRPSGGAERVVEAARLLLRTIDSHDAMTRSCDRDGNEHCECLDENAKPLRDALAALSAPQPETPGDGWKAVAEAGHELSMYAASSREDNTPEFVEGLMERCGNVQRLFRAAPTTPPGDAIDVEVLAREAAEKVAEVFSDAVPVNTEEPAFVTCQMRDAFADAEKRATAIIARAIRAGRGEGQGG